MKNCKYYCKDEQLEGVCLLYSNLSEDMSIIQYCLNGKCGDYKFNFGCKWYKDEFCVNADSPCVADYCPCTEYPELCRYYSVLQSDTPTYEELYKHWLKTKDKPKRKPKKTAESEQLSGQLDLFDIIDNNKEKL